MIKRQQLKGITMKRQLTLLLLAIIVLLCIALSGCDNPTQNENGSGNPSEQHTHTEIIDAKVDPTCTASGLTEGKHCSVCGSIIIKQETIPAKGHTIVVDPKKEPTCSEMGLTEGTHCSVCNQTINKQETISLIAHDYQDFFTIDQEATCEVQGSQSRHCTKCGATTDIQILPMTDHNWDENKQCTMCKTIADYSIGLTYYKIAEHYVVSGIGNCKDSIIIIPSEYKGLPVRTIGDSAFKDCIRVTSVVIPESVNTIESNAFDGCSNIRQITFPNNLIEIHSFAFNNCSCLSDVILPKSLKLLANSAFSNCSSLTNMVIPGTIEYIGEYVFFCCKGLESVVLEEGITSVTNEMFYECDRLTNVSLPSTLERIDFAGFFECSALENIVLPQSLLIIGDFAFGNCNKLKEIVIPDQVASLGKMAFATSYDFRSITLPKNLLSIGESAFLANSSFNEIKYKGTLAEWNSIIKLPDWDKDTANYTVYCTDGTITKGDVVSLYESPSVLRIGVSPILDAFNSFSYSINGELKGLDIELVSIIAHRLGYDETKYIFVIEEYDDLFSSLSEGSLDMIISGMEYANTRSETYLASDGYYCDSESKYVLYATKTNWPLINQINTILTDLSNDKTLAELIDKWIEHPNVSPELATTKLVFKYAADAYTVTGFTNEEAVLVIPTWYDDGVHGKHPVTAIGKYAFSNNSSLEEVCLYNGILLIDEGAFKGCKALKYIFLPDSLNVIGESAFANCSSLDTLVIQRNVTSIGDRAFENSGIKNLQLNCVNANLGVHVFSSCRNLDNPTIAAGTKKIFSAQFDDCESLKTIILPDTIEYIDSFAFGADLGIEIIYLPASIKEIANWAFSGCKKAFIIKYAGSESDWEKIVIGTDNEALYKYTIMFNQTSK